MKITISSQGKELDSAVDPHFGRAAEDIGNIWPDLEKMLKYDELPAVMQV